MTARTRRLLSCRQKLFHQAFAVNPRLLFFATVIWVATDVARANTIERDDPWLWVGASALALALAWSLHATWLHRRLQKDRQLSNAAQNNFQVFARAADQIGDSVVITDISGQIQYVNPAFSAISGYGVEEVLGRKPDILKSGHHSPDFYKRLWDTVKGGQAFNGEFVNRRKDGALYYEDKCITPLRDGAGRIAHIVSTGKDVTEQRRGEERLNIRQEQLAHAARVNAVGEIASTLAHEIISRSPLSPIMRKDAYAGCA